MMLSLSYDLYAGLTIWKFLDAGTHLPFLINDSFGNYSKPQKKKWASRNTTSELNLNN
jgi:hypothetical protein